MSPPAAPKRAKSPPPVAPPPAPARPWSDDVPIGQQLQPRAQPAAALPPLEPAPAPATPSAPRRITPRAADTPSSAARDFVRGAYEVARKDVLQNLRTKRLLVIGIVVSLLLVFITLVFGPAVTGEQPADGPVSKEHTVLLFYFAVGLIGGLQFTQLLAIVLTGDAVCSEWSNRTIFLMLSKPLSRSAFVVGKFAGAAVSVVGSLAILFTLDYLLMQPFYAGSPSSDEVAGFFGMLGIVLLGALAFSAFALFLSSLTRSTAMSIILALSAWLIVFPLIGNIGFFMELGQGTDADLTADHVDAWRYLNPAADMQAGARLLAPEEADVQEVVLFLNVFQTSPEHVDWSIFALVAHTVLWLGLSFLVVQRRNFE